MNTISIEGLEYECIVNVSGVGQCVQFRIHPNLTEKRLKNILRSSLESLCYDNILWDSTYQSICVGMRTDTHIMYDVKRFF
jgi:hypothetical protein